MKKVQRPKALKFSPVHLVVYALILGLVGYIIIRSQAAPNPPTIYLAPSSQTMAPNTTFTVAVRENSATTPVNAVAAVFTYPANLVDFVSIDTTGSGFDTDVTANGGSGKVTIERGRKPPAVTGDQLVATVTFKAKATTGTADMAFTSEAMLVDSVNNANLISASSTGGASFIIDATAPTTTLTTPANGATLAGGSNVTVTATATDNTQVSGVGIYIDGVLRQTLTTSPYVYTWNTSGVALGAHTIQARATDPYGNQGQSTTISVALTDQAAPTASITAPTAGMKLAGTVSINANASDNTGGTGIGKVEFYVDNVLKGTDTASPYTYAWDTKTATEGSHNLTVKAYDQATPANVFTTPAVSVTVENTDKQAPSAPSNLRASSTGFSDITLAWNASTDNIAVTGYRIQRNGATVTTTAGNVVTFKDTGLTAGTSYNYTVTALDAAGNASTAATLTASTVSVKTGDINQDNTVGIADLALMLSSWGSNNTGADLDKNGKVGIVDLSILLSNWGR